MKSLRQNTFLLTASNTIQVAMSLALSIGLARYFEEKEVFGKYQQLFIVVNFFLSLASGIPVGLSYFYGRYLELNNRIRIFKRFWWSIILLAIFFVSISLLFKGILAESFGNDYFIRYTFLIEVLIFLKIANSYFLHFNLVSGKISYHFLITLTSFVLTLALIFAIYIFHFNIRSILLSLISIEIIKLGLFSKNLWFFLKIKGRLTVNKLELNYIIPLTAISLLTTITIYVDKLMISSMLNPELYAEYQVGAFTIPFIGIITGSVVTALIPFLSRLYSENKNSEIIDQFRNATKKTSLFLVPILIYCIVLGDYLIASLYSDTYLSSGKIFQVYTAIYLLSVIGFSAVMNAIGLQNWIVINSIINLCTNALLNFLMIPKFGTMGAVYATLISAYVGYIFPIYLLKKRMNADFLDYFPIKYYFKILTLAVLCSITILVPIKLWELNKWFAVLFSIPYYFLMLYFGGIKEIIELRSGTIRKTIKMKLNG